MYISQNPEQRAKCTSPRNRSLEQNATFSETGAKRKMYIAKEPELRAKRKFLRYRSKKQNAHI